VVGTVELYADFTDSETRQELGVALRRVGEESVPILTAALRASVAEHLGPDFDVTVSTRAGSFELVATILLVGSVVMTYGAVRQGLDYVRKDLNTVAESVVGRGVGRGVGHDPTLAIYVWSKVGPAVSQLTKENVTAGAAPSGPSLTYVTVMGTLVVLALLSLLLVVVLVKVL
jgi:hypothetical protein